MRIPRKQKKKIPKGHYCYTYLKEIITESGDYGGYTIKLCPYLKYIPIKNMTPKPSWMDEEFVKEYGEVKEGWCSLVKCEIEDQCKSCGIKY